MPAMPTLNAHCTLQCVHMHVHILCNKKSKILHTSADKKFFSAIRAFPFCVKRVKSFSLASISDRFSLCRLMSASAPETSLANSSEQILACISLHQALIKKNMFTDIYKQFKLILCSMYYILCSIFYILCTIFYVLCTIFYVLYSMFYVLYSMF